MSYVVPLISLTPFNFIPDLRVKISVRNDKIIFKMLWIIASLASRSARSFPASATWLGTQQRVTIVCPDESEINHDCILLTIDQITVDIFYCLKGTHIISQQSKISIWTCIINFIVSSIAYNSVVYTVESCLILTPITCSPETHAYPTLSSDFYPSV